MIHSIVSNVQPTTLEKNSFILNFDGCSKGNPGLSGAGAVIYNNNIEVWAGYSFVDTSATNNQAEYTGLIIGLKYAVDNQIQDLLVQGDSQLVINQMTGKYKCNADKLVVLYKTAKALEKQIKNVQYAHVLRKFNARADELSNMAVQKYTDDLA
jgi:ribonuclease HI